MLPGASFRDIVTWLQEAIAHFYPDSTYADGLGAELKECAARQILLPLRTGAHLSCPHCGAPNAESEPHGRDRLLHLLALRRRRRSEAAKSPVSGFLWLHSSLSAHALIRARRSSPRNRATHGSDRVVDALARISPCRATERFGGRRSALWAARLLACALVVERRSAFSARKVTAESGSHRGAFVCGGRRSDRRARGRPSSGRARAGSFADNSRGSLSGVR